MHILFTNDDSFDSPLFHLLYDFLEESGHSLTCIMPATEQSWKGKSMTRFGKLALSTQKVAGRSFYTFEGTPADCINFGLYNLCTTAPDLVISGINMGYNVSLSYILSSGTIGAAMEGYLAGYPSLSFSQQLSPEVSQYWNKHRSFPEDVSRHLKKQSQSILTRFTACLSELISDKALWALEMPYQLKEDWQILDSFPSDSHYGSLFAKNEDGTFSHCSPKLENDAKPKSDISIISSGNVALNKLNFSSIGKVAVENI